MYYLALQDAGCPLGRHELTNMEWMGLAMVKDERKRLNGPKPQDEGWEEVPQ